jgi:hypothetical protein
MNLIYGAKQVMHRIRVKLYPNYLPHGEQFFARTDNEASLSIEEVCAAMKNRGGYKGDMSELIDHIQGFFTETALKSAPSLPVQPTLFSKNPVS